MNYGIFKLIFFGSFEWEDWESLASIDASFIQGELLAKD